MKINSYLFCLFLFIQTMAFAQPAELGLIEADPSTVGMSEDRLELLDDHIQSYIDKNWFPGGTFLIARKGKIVYQKSFGYRTVEKKVLYKNDDIFRIASMTKAITTVSIMQLYEKGKLGLDDPIFYYIPAFGAAKVLDTFNEVDSSYTTVPVKRPITIRQLLTHTSGITYGAFNPGKIEIVYGKHDMNMVGLSHDSWTTEEFINKLAAVPLAFQPGEQYMYGLNMDVLGRIVEVASGMSLSDYFHKNIFEPLGMSDTYFYLPKEKQDRLVPIYGQSQEKGIHMAADPGGVGLDYPKLADNNHYAGGGGLSCTAKDYAIFIQSLVNDGNYNGQQILGRKTIEVMTSDQMITLNEKGKGFSNLPGITYGLGFALHTEASNGLDSKSPGTYEWGGYFNTKFFIDPVEDLTFVGMSQIVPFFHEEFWSRMYSIVYGAVEN